MPAMIGPTSLPDTRTTPIPPRPGGVAIAAIVSGAGFDTAGAFMGRTLAADGVYRRFAAASAASFSRTRFMCHCWKICSELLMSQ